MSNDPGDFIADLNAGNVSERVLSEIEPVLERMDQQLDARAVQAMRTEEMDAEMAFRFWARKLAVSDLRRVFSQKKRQGQSAARRLEGVL